MTPTATTVKPGAANLAGLVVVALAAAVLSFAALRNLALACGTPPELAWLWPLTLDAAAVVATRTWLRGDRAARAQRYARTLALIVITVSVAGNATDHFLAMYQLTPPWWLVTVVAAIPPAMLGAVAHLAAVLTMPARAPASADDAARPERAENIPAEIPAAAAEATGRHHKDGEPEPAAAHRPEPVPARRRNQKADGKRARAQARTAVEREGRPEHLNARWICSVIDTRLAGALSQTTLKVIAQELRAEWPAEDDTRPIPTVLVGGKRSA